MTIDISLPSALLAPQPRGTICPRCGGDVRPTGESDTVWCVNHGDQFVGVPMGVPVIEGVHRGVDGRFKHNQLHLYSVQAERQRKKIGETT